MAHFTSKLAPCFLVAATLLGACGDADEGPQFVQIDAPTTVIGMEDEAGSGGELACEPTDLCTRTIEECSVDFAMDACEGWYAEQSNCADMAGYLACNCECLTEAVCADYFSCGEICFEDYCG